MQHETLTLFDNFSVKDVKACDSLSSMSSFQGTPVKPTLTWSCKFESPAKSWILSCHRQSKDSLRKDIRQVKLVLLSGEEEMLLLKNFHGKKVRLIFNITKDIKHSIREHNFECPLNFSKIRGLRQTNYLYSKCKYRLFPLGLQICTR